MWVGFWVNAITGFMLFAADPITKGTTFLFMLKLGLVTLGVILIVVLRRAVYHVPPSDVIIVPTLAKRCAALSLVIWVAATAAGRMMAYW